MKKRLVILFLFFFAFAPAAEVAANGAELDKQQWEKLRDGRDYTDTFKTPKPKKEKEEKKESSSNSSNSSSRNFDFRLGDSRFIIYFIVVILVIALIVRILSKTQSNAKISENALSIDNITEIEERMHELSLDDLLEQAVKAGNLRLALRLNFLIIIKQLSQNKIIKWKKDKTNWEYHREIKNRLVADQFRSVIINFESFWYGEHPLSETNYALADKLYSELRDQLKQNERPQ